MPSEAANMQFIDDSVYERPLERLVTHPIIRFGVGNDTLHGRGRIAPSAVCLGDGDSTAVRIEQDLVAIEAQAQVGLERPHSSKTIDLTRHQVMKKDVPIVIGAVPAGI